MIETFIKKGQTLEEYAIRYVSASIKELPLPEKVKALAILKRYRQLAKISTEMFANLKQIEKKYIKLEEPFLNNIADLVNGKRVIKQSELPDLPKYLSQQEIKDVNQHLEPTKINGYWKTCLKNLSVIKDKIGKEDDQLLDCIENIHVIDEQGTDNFTIVFTMKPNDIIKNTEITKKYYLEHDVPVKCQSSPIQWVSKNLTLKEVKKKQKNKKTGQQRLITKLIKNKSFFNFFTSIDVSDYEANPADLTEEQLKAKEQIEQDFEMGGMIVDDMLPYSLQYYLGVEHQGDEDFQGQQQEEQQNEDDGEQNPKKKGKKQKESKSKSKSKSKGKKQKQTVKPEQKPQCKNQ